jgi:heme exporter protein B
VHWLTSGLLLALISPLLALQFDLSPRATGVLVGSLLLGTPLLSLIGSIGAALTVGVRGAGVLLSLLVLPLVVPVLIFGAGAVAAGEAGLGWGAHFSLLGAMLALSLFLAPLATAAALRIAME